MNKGSCKFCTYSDKDVGFDAYLCKRRAPILYPIVTMNKYESHQNPKWPGVHGEDWCGEWEIKTSPAERERE